MSRRKSKTHFVPKAVLEATFAGVVPICVTATACVGAAPGVADLAFDAGNADALQPGKDVSLEDGAMGTDADGSGFQGSVAFCGFCDGPGVADNAFVPGNAGVADASFGVADGGFVPPPTDADVDASDSAVFAVADGGFHNPDGEDG